MRVNKVKPCISKIVSKSVIKSFHLIEAVRRVVPSIFIALNDRSISKESYEAIKTSSWWGWKMSIQSIFEIIETCVIELGEFWGGGRKSKKSKMSIRQYLFIYSMSQDCRRLILLVKPSKYHKNAIKRAYLYCIV